MSLLLRHLARYVAQKAASDPKVRAAAGKATRGAIEQAKQIAGDDDPAYAAGRAFRRAYDKFQSNR